MRLTLGVILIVILTGIDQISKIWIDSHIPINDPIELIPNFISLAHVKNPGVSFGFLGDSPDYIRLPLLIGIPVIATLVMLYCLIKYWNSSDPYMKIALILILPGAIGNLIDRIIYGVVTDFLQFRWFEITFFSNNFADCFISIGIVFFILSTIITQKNESISTI